MTISTRLKLMKVGQTKGGNMRHIIIITTLVLFTGCASTGLSEEGEKAYFEAQKAAASEPLMEMSCPDEGCKFDSLVVNNPTNDTVQPLQVKQPGVEIAQSMLSTVSAVAPWAAVGTIAVEGIQHAGDNVSRSHNTDSSGSGNTTESTKTNVSDSGNTSTSNTTNERGDTTNIGRDSIGDNSGEQSGNSGRIESPTSDSTSTPTVVDQPDPVVVDPPQGEQ